MMGGGPMAPMPGGAMQMPRPMRRGAPKVVPVIVSAGLAVGVFCGLLFGLGTGKDEASAATSAPKKGSVMSDDSAAPEGLGATAAMPAPPKGGAPAVAPPAPPPAAGSGSAVAAAPTIKTVKLTLKITPEAAAKDAKVVVDGKEITGTSVDLPAEKKSVKVSVTSKDFHTFDKQVDLSGDETTLEAEMLKRSTGGSVGSPGFGGASHTAPVVPKAPPGEKKPKKPAGGGVIDI
jgi:hypothetical protein